MELQVVVAAVFLLTIDVTSAAKWIHLQTTNGVLRNISSSNRAHHVVFKVKAARDAIVVFGHGDDVDTTELVIGARHNSAIIAREGAIGLQLHSTVAPGVISIDKYRTFWLAWQEANLELGHGEVKGQHRIISWQMPRAVIGSPSVTSRGEVTAEWVIFKEDTGDTYVLYTTTEHSYTKNMFATAQSHIVFSVQACKGAFVALSSVPGVTSSQAYEISLGGSDNNLVEIRPGVGLGAVASTTQEGLLNCNSARYFWVSWVSNYLEVGAGYIVGMDRLLDYHIPDVLDYTTFNAVYMSTEFTGGAWEFLKEQARSLHITTTPVYGYIYMSLTLNALERNHFAFRVKAASDAHVELSSSVEGMSEAYEVVVGGWENTESGIRQLPGEHGEWTIRTHTEGILDPHDWTSFWISFDSGHVEVGEGATVGIRRFLYWHFEESFTIRSLSVCNGYGFSGEWQMNQFEEDMYRIRTPETLFSNSLGLSHPYLQFSVRSCQETYVQMLREPGVPTSAVYLLELGAKENSEVRLYEVKDGQYQQVASSARDGFLTCDSLTMFWVASHVTDAGKWHFEVGFGRTVYEESFMSYEVGNQPVIRALSLSSSKLTFGVSDWEFRRSAAQTSVFYTTTDYDYNQIWLTSMETEYVVFKARACSDVHVGLANYPGIYYADMYEVVFGGWNNTKSVIRKELQGISQIEFVQSNVVSCTQMKTYWVSWLGGTIAMGTGSALGESILLSWTDPTPHPINAVGFTNAAGYNGTWEIQKPQGATYTIHSKEDFNFDQIWMMTSRTTFHFKVQSCQEAYICLAQTAYFKDENSAEITIGSNANTETRIRPDRQNMNVEHIVMTRNILDCNQMREFWISWENKVIWVGHGMPYEDEIMAVAHDIDDITAISLSSGNVKQGWWEVDKHEVRVLHVDSPNDYYYHRMWLTTDDHVSQIFRVKAGSDAHVFLAESLGNSQSYSYEIVIGGFDNSRTIIRTSRQGQDMASADTPDILSADQLRTFWVRWIGGHIEIGMGNTVGQNWILDWHDPEPLSVHGFSFSTATGHTGLWEFDSFDGYMVTAHTPDVRNGERVWMKPISQQFLFTVRACHNAHVLLSSGDPSNYVYDIAIGDTGNRETVIRDAQKQVLTKISTPAILHCHEPRAFWLTWADGDIRIGEGSGYNRLIISYQVAEDDANSVTSAVLTTDQGATGEWDFPMVQALEVYAVTEESNSYDVIHITVTSAKYITFTVTACADAHIVVSEIPGVTTYNAYEVALGMDNNRESWIRHNLGGDVLVLRQTPHILDCNEPQMFWIHWWAGVLAVGSGAVAGANRIMFADIETTFNLNSVAVSSGHSQAAQWEFRHWRGATFMATVFPEYDYTYDHVWVAVHKTFCYFNLMACSDGHIALSRTPGVFDEDTYEIVIGGWKNTRSVLRTGRQGSVHAEKDTPDILHCNASQAFWVSWEDGLIEMGAGNSKDSSAPLLAWQDPAHHEVHGVSFSCTDGYTTNWQLWQEQETMIAVQTPDTGKHEHFWFDASFRTLVVFSVKSCNNAYIALSATLGNTDIDAYEVRIGTTSNTRSEIARNGETKHTVDTDQYLSCQESQAFWVSWKDGIVQAGLGPYPLRKQFLNYADPDPIRVNAVSFATLEADGVWSIDKLDGRVYTAYTSETFGWNFAWVYVNDKSYAFRSHACSDVFLTLRDSLDDADEYVIGIGVRDNTESVMTRAGNECARVPTPFVNTCGLYRSFWVMWGQDYVRVGTGTDQFELEFMSCEQQPAKTVSVIGISNGYGYSGEWELPEKGVDRVVLYSLGNDSYVSAWVPTFGYTATTFTVRACSDAYLALAHIHGKTEALSYEVVLDVAGHESQIRSSVGGIVQVTHSGLVLNCEEDTPFWLSWRGGDILIGQGSQVGEQVLMQWTDVDPHEINAISLGTKNGVHGTWVFTTTEDSLPGPTVPSDTSTPTPGTGAPPLEQGDTYVLFPPDDHQYDYNMFVTTQFHIVFTVRAKNDALLALQHVPGVTDTDTYEIVIGGGGNTKAFIRKGLSGTAVAEEAVDDLLSEGEDRYFWISWVGGHIKVGRGYNWQGDTDMFISHQIEERPEYSDYGGFHGVSMATCCGSTSTRYEFVKDQAQVLQAFTRGERDYTTWMTMDEQERHYFLFRVMTASDAHITLTDVINNFSDGYEVIIGGWDNSQSAIRYPPLGEVVVEAQTPGILSEFEWRTFWISYKQGHIETGAGSDVGAKRILAWHAGESYLKVAVVTVSTASSFPAYWELGQFESDTYRVQTAATPDSFTNSLSMHRAYFTFRVRTCKEVNIDLLGTPGDLSTTNYYFTLGSSSNSRAQLYKKVDGSLVEVASGQVTDLLTCDTLRMFWIVADASNGNTLALEAGQGRTVFSDSFIEYTDVSPLPARALSLVSSRAHAEADWDFSEDAVQTKVFTTDGIYAYNNVWVSVMDTDSIMFKARGCSDVHVGLARYPGLSHVLMYEVVIAGWDNSKSVIRTSMQQQDPEAVLEEEGLMDCKKSQHFWVSWTAGRIAFGTGSTVGVREKLDWQDPTPHLVNGVGITSAADYQVTWEFGMPGADTYTIRTMALHSFDKIWLFTSKESFQFRVRACQEANILLAETPFIKDAGIHIKIGSSNNEETSIIPDVSTGSEYTVDTPGILHCETMREFWLTWDNHVVRVGHGRPAEDEILAVPHAIDEVKAFSISTIEHVEGDWEIYKYEARVLHVDSPDDYDYHPMWLTNGAGSTALVFRVKAGSDAHLYLAEYVGVSITDAYEVVIGGFENSKTIIRPGKQGTNEASADTPGILSKDELRSFWISWGSGYLQVGEGHMVGEQRIVDWQDHSPRSVHAITMATGWGYDGHWEFDSYEGEVVTVHTPDDRKLGEFWMAPREEQLMFAVRACHRAHIYLSTGDVHSPLYGIAIGDDRNRDSSIRDSSGTLVLQQPTPGILDCYEERDFWLQWTEDTIRVGEGKEWSRNIFLDYVMPDYKTVSEVSLVTEDYATGEWDFAFSSAVSVHVQTETARWYDLFHLTVLGRDNVIFTLEACKDAHIVLSEIPGITSYNAYEIKLGVSENTESAIYHNRDGDMLVTEQTPEILHCFQPRTFWIRWPGIGTKELHVGFGDVVGTDKFMGTAIEAGFLLNSLSVSSGFTETGKWEFKYEDKDYASTTTKDPEPPSSHSTHHASGSSSTASSTSTTSSTTTTAPDFETEDTASLSTEAIIGITFGCIIFAMIVSIASIVLYQRNKYVHEQKESAPIHFDNPLYSNSQVPTTVELGSAVPGSMDT